MTPIARRARRAGTRTNSLSAARPQNDDWTNVTDLAERRRIQNRLAQRNYRKRLKLRAEEERLQRDAIMGPAIIPPLFPFARTSASAASAAAAAAATGRAGQRPSSPSIGVTITATSIASASSASPSSSASGSPLSARTAYPLSMLPRPGPFNCAVSPPSSLGAGFGSGSTFGPGSMVSPNFGPTSSFGLGLFDSGSSTGGSAYGCSYQPIQTDRYSAPTSLFPPVSSLRTSSTAVNSTGYHGSSQQSHLDRFGHLSPQSSGSSSTPSPGQQSRYLRPPVSPPLPTLAIGLPLSPPFGTSSDAGSFFYASSATAGSDSADYAPALSRPQQQPSTVSRPSGYQTYYATHQADHFAAEYPAIPTAWTGSSNHGHQQGQPCSVQADSEQNQPQTQPESRLFESY